jgi:DNA-binding HxlR family transcriptional regulator
MERTRGGMVAYETFKYGQYCPVAKAVEIIGDRWTLLIVRDLLLGKHRFNDLERGLPGISRSLLAQRLRRLEQTGLLERREIPDRRATEYHLTPAGQGLQQVMDALLGWGVQWVFGEPELEELDPRLLLWWMKDRINRERLPRRRTVVQFDFRGDRGGSFWLVLEPDDVSVCDQHPGFDVDLLVRADLEAFYRVWIGRAAYAAAQQEGLVELEGPPSLVKAFPGWLAWSPFISTVRSLQD